MNSAKTTNDSHSKTKISPHTSKQGSKQDSLKQAPDNLMVLNSDSSARDLNTRLQEMEAELLQLSEHLDSSHQSLHQTLLQNNQDSRSEVKNSQEKLSHLENSFDHLEKQSDSLAQETARLALVLSENAQQQSDAVNTLEENSIEKFSLVAKQIELLDEQVLQLGSDYTTLKQASESLINEVSLKTSSLEESLSEHAGDFKKLAHDVEIRNKSLDSQLEQVGRNFSFHDAKILKLHEKDTELDNKNTSLKELLKHTKSEQKESVTVLEKNLKTEILSVSDEAEQKYQVLTGDHKKLEQRTTQVESKANQLDIDLQTTEQKHQEQLLDHESRLSTHNRNLHSHETRIEQLKTVDEELNLRAEGLRKTTERLDEHGNALEKTTISLREQSHELKKAVTVLDEQNEQLEDKTEQLGLQIASNAQSERQHFQTMTMAVSIVAILTIIALIYSFINQQSLWQSSMDNDIVIERRMNVQLTEQSIQMAVAEQHRGQLSNNIEVLQTQLKAEQKKVDGLLKASQDKSKKIVQLKGELKNIDDNVQFLNTSVGPLKDYTRNTGELALHNAAWLAQQSGEHFAIQLTSVDSKQKLYQFVEQYGYSLQDDLAWFTINSKGKDYYILTYGNFQALSQARAVLSQLPSFMTENSPGISRMKDIQTFIH